MVTSQQARLCTSSCCRYLCIVLVALTVWELLPGWQSQAFARKALNALRWQQIESNKAKLQPYSLREEDLLKLPTWVVSLQRSPERRKSISTQLTAASMPFEIVDAVDGMGHLDEMEVAYTESAGRASSFLAQGKLMGAKVGCDLSHIRLLHRMQGEPVELALILEDDAQIPIDFKEQLLSALTSLPDDWDMLQLNSCNPKISKRPVRANIHVTHESSCTLAYICRRSFALKDVKSCKVLDAVAARRLHKDIDDFFGWLISSGKVQAYMTVPFIVERSALAKNSTIQIWA